MSRENGYYDSALGAYLPNDPTSNCEKCGVLVDEEHYNPDLDMWICDECLELYIECSTCGKLFQDEDIIECNGVEYCQDCAIEESEEEME